MTKQQRLMIIMIGGQHLVQSKPLDTDEISKLVERIDAGLEPNDRTSKVLPVPMKGETEYIVIPNIATFRVTDYDPDEESTAPPW